ncbi:MAG: AAA family ATPase [Candidatus Binatia bacterium]
MHGWLDKALNGERQVVFVTGEAGIGKTSLVEAFLAQIETSGAVQSPKPVLSVVEGSKVQSPQLTTDHWPLATCLVGRGQCIEHYGAGEAYLPVLDALDQQL